MDKIKTSLLSCRTVFVTEVEAHPAIKIINVSISILMSVRVLPPTFRYKPLWLIFPYYYYLIPIEPPQQEHVSVYFHEVEGRNC